jgi:DNA-binding transcriptional MocR family regulator
VLFRSRRQALAGRVLAGLPLVRHPASYFLWLPLGEDQRAERVAAFLARQGVAVSTAEAFATTAHVPQALRLALGSATMEALRQALGLVREAVAADAS